MDNTTSQLRQNISEAHQRIAQRIKPSDILAESMTSLEFNGLKIRCWREEDLSYFSQDKTAVEIKDLLTNLSPDLSPKAIAFTLLKHIPRMNAVEVVNSFGNGIVLYSSWP